MYIQIVKHTMSTISIKTDDNAIIVDIATISKQLSTIKSFAWLSAAVLFVCVIHISRNYDILTNTYATLLMLILNYMLCDVAYHAILDTLIEHNYTLKNLIDHDRGDWIDAQLDGIRLKHVIFDSGFTINLLIE